MITFKTDEMFYYKELLGIKPNTFRKVIATDKRFNKLSQLQNKHHLGKIKIMNVVGHKPTGEYFIREIQDISFFEGFVIISWLHDVTDMNILQAIEHIREGCYEASYTK